MLVGGEGECVEGGEGGDEGGGEREGHLMVVCGERDVERDGVVLGRVAGIGRCFVLMVYDYTLILSFRRGLLQIMN